MRVVARAFALFSLIAARAAAEPGTGAPVTLPARGTAPRNGYAALREGWSSFSDHFLLLDMVLVLLLALALGAIIAYHPSIRRRASNLEQFEQPKTLLMYAVVAAVVALIVQVQPAMAFVIFGIGGLLRFRTEVGDAKDTGRVILVTVLGLCCGLKIYIVALPAAVIGWLLIFILEQQITGIIRVSGVGEQGMHEATRTHRALIAAAGCRIIRRADQVHQTRICVRREGAADARPREAPSRVRCTRSRVARRGGLGASLSGSCSGCPWWAELARP